MSDSSSNIKHGDADQEAVLYADEKPAIGLVVTEDNEDEIARALLRAVRHDCQILLTYRGESVPETFDFADPEYLHVIDPPTAADGVDHRQTLTTAARALSFPGLVFHGTGHPRIDYAASLSAFEDGEDYCIAPVLQSATSGESAGTLVAIPAYNEAAAIESVVAGAREHAHEVLVIDDGSTDDTVAQAEAAGANVIRHATNGGYGAALQTAFLEAANRRVERLVVLDGDGQHDPADIPRLVAALEDGGADVAIGSRFVADADTTIPFYRRVGLAVVNLLSNLSLGVVRSRSWIGDTQSGYRAYDWRAIRSLAADEEIGDRMSASTDILYHAQHNNYEIEEVGTTIDYEVENGSHHHPVSHGIHLVMNIVRTVERDRPILFLGVPGFVSAFVGLGFGYWTVVNFLESGGFAVGLAITSMFFVLVGVFACFSAIMLHALSSQLQQ
jgi:glycosyltransferase involved in cell wall biosynthesis